MLIDAHAHLDNYEEDDLESVLEEINQHRIFTISVSMDVLSYRKNLAIGKKCALVLPTFGVHPWNAPEYAHHLEELGEPISRSPMLGEIGLDYSFVKDTSEYPAQREVLEFFLAAAGEQEKIVNLHTTGAEDEIVRLLDRYGVRRAIVHWYSGPQDALRELIDRGAYFTVSAEVLYSEQIQAIARQLPTELLLTETDNPGGLQWLTGTPGTPVSLEDVVNKLAEVRQTDAGAIVQAVRDNFLRLIGDDPRLADVRSRIEGET